MEDNEIMEMNEEVVEETNTETTERSGKSRFGLGMLVGGALLAGGYACGRKLKKVLADRKAKKELKKAEAEDFADEEIVEGEIVEEK